MDYLTPPPSPQREASPARKSSLPCLYSLTPPSSPQRQASPIRKASLTRLSSITPPSSRNSSPAGPRLPHNFTSRYNPPKTLHRILSHHLAQEKRTKRLRKTKHIALQNTRLCLENKRLQAELATLNASTSQSEEEIFHLRTKNTSLLDENTELKKTLAFQKPLVKIGVSIRERFLEKTRSGRYHKPERADIVQEGNAAAHECCVTADAALFELGYMHAIEKSVKLPREYFRIDGDGKIMAETEEMGQRVGMRYKDLFYDLYGREPREARSYLWGERDRRVWDMIGTMLSCCEGFEFGETESGDDWFDRFNELVEEIHGVKKEIEELYEDKDERVKAFEASEEVNVKLKEMKDIVEETRLWSWRRNRTLMGGSGVERGMEVGMDEEMANEHELDEVTRGTGESGHETELGKDYDILMEK